MCDADNEGKGCMENVLAQVCICGSLGAQMPGWTHEEPQQESYLSLVMAEII